MRHPSFTIGCFVVVSASFPARTFSTHDAVQVVSPVICWRNPSKPLSRETHPGFAAAVLQRYGTFWKGFGFADLDVKKAVHPNTKQMLASISKHLLAWALWKCGEGKIDWMPPSTPTFLLKWRIPTTPWYAYHCTAIGHAYLEHQRFVEYNLSFLKPVEKEDFNPAWHDLIAL